MWRFAVEELADFADALLAHVFEDAVEHFLHGAAGRLAAAVEPGVGTDKWTEQPGEGRSLMVGAIADDGWAGVMALIIRVGARERSQPDRREQFLFHLLEHGALARRIEHGMSEAGGENLIGTNR